ncbi:MAG: PSD1 domain-containing protein [Pirellulaceae bacterium]|nr:PSD1 domain-containing protein [Pirellulaceae bacterium]
MLCQTPRPWFPRLAAVMLTVCLPFVVRSSAVADEEIDFNRDIRPLFSDKCFACHGPDDAHREGGFRLDQKASALGQADSGATVIVPGQPDGSELIARITSDDDSLRMPPAESDKTLTADEIARIRQWIGQGAQWQEHWSLVAPRRPELPVVQDAAWPRNPIDRFVRARQEALGLPHAPQADPYTLVRRVTLDLTGLPPTIAEVEAFVNDKSPEAYERLVDRLLRSQACGQHMARFWLDAARYGDTHGLHLDNYREMWPYRDWVVQAFNDNLPYDQFVIQQLAGDLLPNPTLDQLVATGFNRAHVTTNEGGSIAEEVYVRNVVDCTVTFGTVFMGLTLDCTRCHDHKFDPLTMQDFYSLFAFFNSMDGSPLDGNRKDPAPVIKVPTDQQQQQLADYDRQLAAAEQRLAGPWPEVDQQQAEWERQLAAAGEPAADPAAGALTLSDWHSVGPFNDTQRYLFARKHGPEDKPIKLDQSFELADGAKVAWVRHPEWKDGVVHQGLPGDEAANFLYRTLTVAEPRKVAISLGSDDALKVYLNGKQVLAKDIARAAAADQETLELELKAGENQLLLKVMNYGGASGFYFAVKSGGTVIPAEILTLARKPAEERSAAEQQSLRDYYRNKVSSAAELEAARSELAKLREARAAVDREIPTTLIFRDTKDPKPAHCLKRGEYDQPGDQVERRTPLALPPLADDLPRNRLGLAQWLVSPQHPLTARVAVNRFWLQLFGTGLVKTAEDFGSQGEPPSHPLLLDWLALQFVEDGWDIKATMKRMVMSATYRQSSRVVPDVHRRDPANRLLTRGPRFRLDAEMLRDQALHVSGLLSEQMGGPSVKPPQPDGLWFAVGYSGSNTVRFKADAGHDKVHRRTLYTFIKRTAPPPQMSIVDAPSREACVVRRERTNTPLQALLLLNDPQYVEAARGLAQRALREGGADAASRAAYMFRLCTARPPADEELQDLVAGFQEELAHYQQHPAEAARLVQVGEAPAPSPDEVIEVAAWTALANMLLNLDEVVTKN